MKIFLKKFKKIFIRGGGYDFTNPAAPFVSLFFKKGALWWVAIKVLTVESASVLTLPIILFFVFKVP